MMTEIDYRKVTGLVHSTESFGSVDGPGVRFVVFMQGCHMRCQYAITQILGIWSIQQRLRERQKMS